LKETQKKLITNATLLFDSSITIEGITIFGSSYQPSIPNHKLMGFNGSRGSEMAKFWECLPQSCDILVTHGPPHQILDSTFMGLNVGCEELRKKVEQIKPQFHCFGHIHEAHGIFVGDFSTFINAAICTLGYSATNEIPVFDIKKK